MACAQPFLISNPHYKDWRYTNAIKPYLEVPCNWCLNCRVDRQNWLCDAMKYEWKKYNYKAAFVTFTYDDVHLQELNNVVADDFVIVKEDDGTNHKILMKGNKPIEFSLRRKHAKDFLKRVRSQIDYYYEKYNIENFESIRKDFKTFYCGEYGDIFGRPHYHFIFFGLAHDFCEELLMDCWQNGLIDVLPIKDGAFEYVTKYLQKQLHNSQAEEVYDKNNLERPFCSHSLGLGKGIILDNLDYIKSHSGCYLTDNNLLRPIPIYYKNALKIRSVISNKRVCNNMISLGVKADNPYYLNGLNAANRYSLKTINEFRKQQAILRHQKLERQYFNSGQSFDPLIQYGYSGRDKIPELVKAALLDTVPF